MFPRVGAKAALYRDGMRFVVARDFGSAWDDLRIIPALLDIAASYRADRFRSSRWWCCSKAARPTARRRSKPRSGTACSALQSNNGAFKPIHWDVLD